MDFALQSLSSTPVTDASKAKPRNPPAVSTEQRRVRTLLPRSRTDDSGPVTDPPPPHNPYTRSAAAILEQQAQPHTPLGNYLLSTIYIHCNNYYIICK